jgi:hypothetical protein
MTLLSSLPLHDDGDESGASSDYVDAIAGLPRLTSTGGIVYVKPVDHLEEKRDLSSVQDDNGLFQKTPVRADSNIAEVKAPYHPSSAQQQNRIKEMDGEKLEKFKEVEAFRLYAERGVTFWRFLIEVELGPRQARIAYRINHGPAIGFWVPARGDAMNIMFHTCNGFSLNVNPDQFCGPDPLWRDVLNAHQARPFHVMVGGGDQIYNDVIMKQSAEFQRWLKIRNAAHKHSVEFRAEMQDELERCYLERYAQWFSQGLFGMANSQIPAVNIWDDHDIIDGFGSYSHAFMSSPVISGLGSVAYKYYLLFQHQSVVTEASAEEPSWLIGANWGPYINELSRNVFMFLGRQVAFLGVDCRTERTVSFSFQQNSPLHLRTHSF